VISFHVPPPKFKWGDIPKFKDSGYCYPTVQIAEIGQDIYIRFSGRGVMYARVKGWRNIPLTTIIADQIEINGGMCRHLENALHWFYKAKGVSMGYTTPIVK